jgi:hypothetical protein
MGLTSKQYICIVSKRYYLFTRPASPIHVQIPKSLIQICMAGRVGKLFRRVFLIMLPKFYRHDLNIGYIDASQHQLQYALKIRV